jgi:hypothetical protein
MVLILYQIAQEMQPDRTFPVESFDSSIVDISDRVKPPHHKLPSKIEKVISRDMATTLNNIPNPCVRLLANSSSIV